MSDGTADVSRRTFLRTASGAAAIAAASGAASAQENGTSGGNQTGSGGGGGSSGPPDFGSWFSNVGYWSGNVVDATGKDEVTVDVGADANNGLAFGPVAVHVDSGATVVWQWTGEGGGHNVISEGDGPLDSGSPVADESATYEYSFESDGIYKYFCQPHRASGMKGAVVVGSDYPTVETPAPGEGGPALPNSAKSLGIATSFVMAATLGLTYFFMKFGGDYEQPDA